MNISRRKFFFFGLAAGVGLLLPDRKIWTWDRTRIYVISESDIVAAELNKMLPHIKNLFDRDDIFYNTIRSKQKIEYISLP